MRPDYAYTHRQHGDDGRDDALVARILGKLWQHYPGWAWYVEIPPNQNIIVIKNFDLGARGKPWGFVIHKDSIDPSLKIVMRGGGEILERWRRRRGRVAVADLMNPGTPFERPET